LPNLPKAAPPSPSVTPLHLATLPPTPPMILATMTFPFEVAAMRIYIDVETIPGQIMGAKEAARAGVKPPANYKKPETIAAWWAEEGEAAVERAYRAQALDAAQGEAGGYLLGHRRHRTPGRHPRPW